MVAATPSRARATNSAARAVVMCSNTTFKRGEALDERAEGFLDEHGLAVEHIDFGACGLAVHEQRHAALLHALEHGIGLARYP